MQNVPMMKGVPSRLMPRYWRVYGRIVGVLPKKMLIGSRNSNPNSMVKIENASV